MPYLITPTTGTSPEAAVVATAAATTAAAAWSAPAPQPSTPPKVSTASRLVPFIGPIALFIVWDFAVRFGFIKAILLPSPSATLVALVTGFAGGTLLLDFGVTFLRTLQAFMVAAVVGVPLGVLLGSNEKAYRSVEFLIDFFRSTPSSALIPLFLLIFGVSDINKVAIAAFGAFLATASSSSSTAASGPGCAPRRT